MQVSRFDTWKDPRGVIEAFQLARKHIDATLVLVGNIATDDPEGQEVFESLCSCSEERIRVLSVQDSALVNALQRRAEVVVQKRSVDPEVEVRGVAPRALVIPR